MTTALDAAKRGPWLVEVDVVDPDHVPHTYRQTLICESYDGTVAGAASYAADVLDWCEVTVRSVHRSHGLVVEARSKQRLDEPPVSVERRNLSQAWSQRPSMHERAASIAAGVEAPTVEQLESTVRTLDWLAALAEEMEHELAGPVREARAFAAAAANYA